MPILDVEIVLQSGELLADNLAQTLADRLGLVFGSQPEQTWLKLRPLPHIHYAENDSRAENYPVFVSVLKRQRSSPAKMQVEVTEITTAVAEICQRSPENIHILYLPTAAGRMAFGGKIVPDNKRKT